MGRAATPLDEGPTGQSVITSTLVPDLGRVAFSLRDVYRAEDALHGLAYQRRAGVHRLAKVVGDQLDLDEETAILVAARLLGGLCDA